jgi:hypothetical protein
MKKHLLHALALSSPFILVTIPTLLMLATSLITSIFIKQNIALKSQFEIFWMLDFPAILLFITSVCLLSFVYYLAYKKKSVSLKLSYIFTLPLIATIYITITELVMPIFNGSLEGSGEGGLALILVTPFIFAMFVASFLYLYLSHKKIREIYNSK